MSIFSRQNPKICIIGRVSFEYSIGYITYAICEALSKNFSICVLPTEIELRVNDEILLPSGRRVPVCKDLAAIDVSIFVDILSQGESDFNFGLAPTGSLKIAYIVFDSDQLPRRWVQILNNVFDLCLVPSPHLIETCKNSGVRIPVGAIPIPLELEHLLARETTDRVPEIVNFGSVASFHPRKNLELLLESFTEEFSKDEARLTFHSNLSMGRTFSRLTNIPAQSQISDVCFSHAQLTSEEKDSLIESFDVFCNLSRGESYSIGPREALALGKTVVLSEVGGHLDLIGAPGIFPVKPSMLVPGRYVELENLVFGRQALVSKSDARKALRAAFNFVRNGSARRTQIERRKIAQHFTFSRLSTDFAALINNEIYQFRRSAFHSKFTQIPEIFRRKVAGRIGSRAEKLGYSNIIHVPLFDAGFFSLFNAFVSHLVWGLKDERCHAVMPKWFVGDLLKSVDENNITSFCYGTSSDGNLWTKLFQPLYGLSVDEMQSSAWPWLLSEEVSDRHNGVREPNMTYVNAYELYESLSFKHWRKQFGRAVRDHIHLSEKLQTDVENFHKKHLFGKFSIGVHCRHPSHTVEQPGSRIALASDYIATVHAQLALRGIEIESDCWTVFIATDTGRAIDAFTKAFGTRVVYYSDVRRTSDIEDNKFDAIDKGDGQIGDGFQLQHILAKQTEDWNINFAEQIVRDAWTLARCQVLVHVVSNVSTAVSYINPEIEMVFCHRA